MTLLAPTPEPDEHPTFIKRFFANFGTVPEQRPPIIPKPFRIPFFIALSVLALVALLLVIWLLVLPGIRAQQSSGAATRPPASTTK